MDSHSYRESWRYEFFEWLQENFLCQYISEHVGIRETDMPLLLDHIFTHIRMGNRNIMINHLQRLMM